MRRILAVVVASLTLAACGTASEGGSSDGGGPVTIRMGTIPTSGMAIIHVMANPPSDLKLEGNNNAYKLEFFSFAGSPEITQGLATGTLDAGVVGVTSIFPALKADVKLRITGEFFEERSGWLSTTWLVKKGSGITSAADMRGKVMGTNSVGSPVYWIGKSYLSDAGLEEGKDYKVVAVPFANMEEAIDSGKVDVGPMVMPFLKRALDSGKFDVLFADTDVQDPYVQSVMAFRQSFIDQHPDAVKAFIADWRTTAQYIRDEANHDKVIEAIAKTMNVPADSLQYVGTRDFYYVPENGRPNVEAIQANWDWFYKVGGVDKQYNIRDYIDEQYLP